MRAEIWFRIKCRAQVSNGHAQVSHTLNALRNLDSSRVSSVVTRMFQMNAFFVHSENVLLAMNSNQRQYIRELAWIRIKRVRAEQYEK